MDDHHTNKRKQVNSKALFLSGAINTLLNVAISAGILFLSATTVDWLMGWLYVFSYLVFRLMSLYFSINRTQQGGTDSPLIERILDLGYSLTHPITLLIAGFEFNLTQHPFGLTPLVQITALAFLILTFVLMLWAQKENPLYFFNKTNFHPEDDLVNSGPYQFIRHPGYAGLFMLALVRPLVLGSRMGLLIGITGASLIILKTVREDWLLQTENDSYKQYANAVKHKMFSGIW